MTIDQRGRILLGRASFYPNGAPGYPSVERLHPTGALDTTYGRGGTVILSPVTNETAGKMAVDARGRNVVALATLRPRAGVNSVLRLMRLTAEGKLDRGFGRKGLALSALPLNGFVSPLQVLSQGRNRVVVVARVSYFEQDDNRIALLRYFNGR